MVIALLCALNAVVWHLIFSQASAVSAIYFLNVGQGDSSLVVMADHNGHQARLLIDGGPINGLAKRNLETILPLNDRKIDIAVVTHPQADHYGGLIEVLDYFDVGMVLTDGKESTNASWKAFKEVVARRHIPLRTIDEYDRITYSDFVLHAFGPDPAEHPKDINDSSVVLRLDGGGFHALFTADISGEKERNIAREFDVDVDILKASHHGSRFSSDSAFLAEVTPRVAVVSTGKNTYGHPTAQALNRLAAAGARIFRTDKDGLIKITADNGAVQVFSL